MIDVVQQVRDNKAHFEWVEVVSEHEDNKLFIAVTRDAVKFNKVPALTWDFKPVPGDDRTFDGVRLPANAQQLQQIADLLYAMLLTPRVIDLIWLQAGLKFDAIVNVKGNIVAVSNISDVHEAIEAKIEQLGGDDGTKLVSCVGKYWCLVDQLASPGGLRFKDKTACNYGWCAKQASGPGVTPGVQCWQRPGFAHDFNHWDPSQTIRLMFRTARLVRADGSEEYVDLRDVAVDPKLAPLINYTGKPLGVVRQPGVEEEPAQGAITMPTITIEAEPPSNPPEAVS